MLFPGGDPFEDLIELSPPRFPYLPAPPGFAPIVRPSEIPDQVEPPSPFADSLTFLDASYRNGRSGVAGIIIVIISD